MGAGNCVVCGRPVTYGHYASELGDGCICADESRDCWERHWLSVPWPKHWSDITDTWHIWFHGRWVDDGWYYTEGA